MEDSESTSCKDSMASSTISRDDFPIASISELPETAITSDTTTITSTTTSTSAPTTPTIITTPPSSDNVFPESSKLDSPTSDDSCNDSMFSSKESSLILDDLKTRGNLIATFYLYLYIFIK